MEEKVTMKIGSKEFQNILESYYKEKTKEESIKMTINPKTRLVGIYEDIETYVEVTLTRQIKVGDIPATLEEKLDKKDVIESLSDILNSQDFEVKNVTYQTASIGYYQNNDLSFNGVTVEMKRKQKVLAHQTRM